MIHRYNGQRTIIIACFGLAIFAAIALHNNATAQSSLLLRLWHDQDSSASVTSDDIVAADVEVTVTQVNCASLCAAWIVTTDSAGYASITLHDGEYEIEAPCMAMTVQAADVSGQSVQEWTTCLQGVWLAAIAR